MEGLEAIEDCEASAGGRFSPDDTGCEDCWLEPACPDVSLLGVAERDRPERRVVGVPPGGGGSAMVAHLYILGMHMCVRELESSDRIFLRFKPESSNRSFLRFGFGSKSQFFAIRARKLRSQFFAIWIGSKSQICAIRARKLKSQFFAIWPESQIADLCDLSPKAQIADFCDLTRKPNRSFMRFKPESSNRRFGAGAGDADRIDLRVTLEGQTELSMCV